MINHVTTNHSPLAYEVCKSLKLNYGIPRLNPFQINATILSHGTNSKTLQKTYWTLPNAIVILTAIEEEYNAVDINLKEVKLTLIMMTQSIWSRNILRIIEIHKVIIRECGVLRIQLLLKKTERAISHFQANLMQSFLLGMQALVKPNDFNWDVISQEKFGISTESGVKPKKDKFCLTRLSIFNVCLQKLQKKERRKDEWKTLIKKWLGHKSESQFGHNCSVNNSIEDCESGSRKILTEHYNVLSSWNGRSLDLAKAAMRQGRSSGKDDRRCKRYWYN
jgi:hypothetical protein